MKMASIGPFSVSKILTSLSSNADVLQNLLHWSQPCDVDKVCVFFFGFLMSKLILGQDFVLRLNQFLPHSVKTSRDVQSFSVCGDLEPWSARISAGSGGPVVHLSIFL